MEKWRQRARYVLVTVVVGFTWACGDRGSGLNDALESDKDVPGLELPEFGGADIGTGSTAAADSALKTDAAASCPGGPGCPCELNGDCDAGLCLETATGRRCAASCVDTCTSSFRCSSVSQGADVQVVCVDPFARLCSPCSSNKDCKHPGVAGARCIDRGNAGNFCGVDCSSNIDCPGGYQCVAVTDVASNSTKQCVKPSGDACECNKNAIALGFSTPCEKALRKGGETFTCSGSRSCATAGLSDCKTPELGPEKCDGVDNDCDGKTDEDACDDGQTCTTDVCNADKGCDYQPVANGLPCDADGNVCTEKDKCQGGKCKAGGVKSCDDKNPCTSDTCLPASGCTQTDDDGTPCDDENPCTIGDTCGDGSCTAGKPKACESGKDCVVGECSLATGKCEFDNAPGTKTCDDGDKCTKADACSKGKCVGHAVKCDDGNPCTADSCKPASGCEHAPTSGACSDGDKCTLADTCKGGACLAGQKKDCDDKNPCTVDTCAADGVCGHVGLPLEGTPCDADGSFCTKGDACKSGKCTAGAGVDCDDKNVCTKDACAPDKGCTHTPTNGSCDADGNDCTADDACNDSKCVAGPPKTCNDKNPCTKDSCDQKTGACSYAGLPMEGTPCNADSSVCTKGDACKSGKCAPGAAIDCDDKNVCTNDACAPDNGCTHTPTDGSCDADGNPCTTGDSCKDSKCAVGQPKACNDKNPCTKDTCDQKTGACASSYATTDGVACDADGTNCTVGDDCIGGKCTPGKAANCDDANTCTVDSCDKPTGKCGHQPISKADAPCEADGSVCTKGDVCKAGTCTVGTKIDCDDKNSCTDDSCDAKAGCSHSANGASCDDGNKCSANDACKNKTCTAGSTINCDDKNSCTKDTCDPAVGCKNTALADGTGCGELKACIGGSCFAKCPLWDKTYSGMSYAFDVASVGTGAGFALATSVPGKLGNDAAVGRVALDGTKLKTTSFGLRGFTKEVEAAGGSGRGLSVIHYDNGKYRDWLYRTDGNDLILWKATLGIVFNEGSGDLRRRADGTWLRVAAGGIGTRLSFVSAGGKLLKQVEYHSNNMQTPSALHLPKQGGGLLVGTVSMNYSNAALLRFKADGTELWHRNYSGGLWDRAAMAFDGAAGGFVVVGHRQPDPKQGGYDGWLFWTDAAGKLTAQKSYGGAQDDIFLAAVQGSDAKGWLLGGHTSSKGAGGPDSWLVRVGSAGEVLWERTFGTSKVDVAEALVALDGGYLVATRTNAGGSLWAPRLLRLNAAGIAECLGDGACADKVAGDCDDSNVCTIDKCDALKGCVHAPSLESAPCDDGNACTIGDSCKKQTCVAGSSKDCDDKNPCTKDDCAPQAGCKYTPLADGTACGAAFKCETGKCVKACSGTQTFTATGKPTVFAVPDCAGVVAIEVCGAQGGAKDATGCKNPKPASGGRGACMKCTFAALAGNNIVVRVGTKGGKSVAWPACWSAAGGGGASWVFFEPTNGLLAVAGGGGGANYNGVAGQPGLTTTAGGLGGFETATSGGKGGYTNGGSGGGAGGGGGGLLTDGMSNQWSQGGKAGGGPGGSGYCGSKGCGGRGGYGGGGAGYAGGGGGGGYSGGNGGQIYGAAGGGGGSFCTGVVQSSAAGANAGNGRATVSW